MSSNKIKAIIFLIILAVIIFAAGVWLGMIYQSKNDTAKIASAQKAQSAVKSLSSDLVSSMLVYGKVQLVGDNSVTITYLGKNLVIPVTSRTQIMGFKKPTGKFNPAAPELDALSDIKIGDMVNVNLKLASDGSFSALYIVSFS